MKIKIKEISYEELTALPKQKQKKPTKQNFFWRSLLRLVSIPDLLATHFCCKRIGMDQLGKREPALFLMNHSSFIDLKIAATVLYPRRYNIICTTDGFVGKRWLMRRLGCIPTNKFVTDLKLVRDISYATQKLNSSVLMYPEAGYSFDGTATLLPDSLGRFVKFLGVPLVMIRTFGAFARDPLYNNLQRRRVRVTAEMEYLLSPAQIKEMSAEEISDVIAKNFTFDAFKWQQENQICINEDFRADHLDRVLYKCPACHAEGEMQGKGTQLVCHRCHKSWTLDEYGFLQANEGETEIAHVPSWYEWERACVREELAKDAYRMESDVEIYALTGSKCLYRVGEGHLSHSRNGFCLTGCNGKLSYEQGPMTSYTLNADFNWYEIGDVISIGNNSCLYYCFPKEKNLPVAKARLATEELYKLLMQEKKQRKKQT